MCLVNGAFFVWCGFYIAAIDICSWRYMISWPATLKLQICIVLLSSFSGGKNFQGECWQMNLKMKTNLWILRMDSSVSPKAQKTKLWVLMTDPNWILQMSFLAAGGISMKACIGFYDEAIALYDVSPVANSNLSLQSNLSRSFFCPCTPTTYRI